MKILEVADSGFLGTDQMGPVTNDIFNLSQEFARHGHQVTVVDVKAQAPRTRLTPDIPLVEVKGQSQPLLTAKAHMGKTRVGRLIRRQVINGRKWINPLVFLLSLRRRLPLDDFDIVHVHKARLALLMPSLLGTRPVYTSHTPNWIAKWGGAGRRKRLWRHTHAYMGHELNAIRQSRATVCLGDHLKRLCPDYSVTIIPNGTRPAQWKRRDKAEARAALGCRPDDFLVYFVGRVTPIKGLDTLLAAVKLAAIPRLKLKVIGSLSSGFNTGGATSAYAKGLLQKAEPLSNVEFLGFINNRSETFQLHLSAADLLVIPSLFENQANVALEALAFEVPIIASEVGGLAQMVPTTVGRLVSPGDPHGLAEQIRFLSDHPETLEFMGRHCRAHLEANFTWDVCARRHLELFEALRQDESLPEETAHETTAH